MSDTPTGSGSARAAGGAGGGGGGREIAEGPERSPLVGTKRTAFESWMSLSQEQKEVLAYLDGMLGSMVERGAVPGEVRARLRRAFPFLTEIPDVT